ncbi:MAG: hypothetical protein ACR2QB_08490 [Gammaproteobacteria bacterium]
MGGVGGIVLLLGLLLGGCTQTGLNPSEPVPAVHWTDATSIPAESPVPVMQPADTALAARAASRDGPGGYQRTRVPPGFLVLMLGVPLLILLL